MMTPTTPATAIATASHTRVAARSQRPGATRCPFIGFCLGRSSADSVPDMPRPDPLDIALTRRTLLRGAIGGTAAVAASGLPAWARFSHAHAHLRRPDSLPFPRLPAGTPSMHQIKHIVVLIMENHSFDNVLGMVPHQLAGREAVDGLTVVRG